LRLGWIATALAAAGVIGALVASRNNGTPDPQAGVTSTASVTTTAARPATSTTAPKYIIPADTAAAGTSAGLNPFGGDSPEDKRMPDVICMNLQDAQDEIQDHGVFFSTSVDATGDGRRQLLDRNWVVVDQNPAPGEKIGEGDAVLSVVKKDEPNDCP
jgi:PASTA domain-containing protein